MGIVITVLKTALQEDRKKRLVEEKEKMVARFLTRSLGNIRSAPVLDFTFRMLQKNVL